MRFAKLGKLEYSIGISKLFTIPGERFCVLDLNLWPFCYSNPIFDSLRQNVGEKKFHIRETTTLSACADSSTNTIKSNQPGPEG